MDFGAILGPKIDPKWRKKTASKNSAILRRSCKIFRVGKDLVVGLGMAPWRPPQYAPDTSKKERKKGRMEERRKILRREGKKGRMLGMTERAPSARVEL